MYIFFIRLIKNCVLLALFLPLKFQKKRYGQEMVRESWYQFDTANNMFAFFISGSLSIFESRDQHENLFFVFFKKKIWTAISNQPAVDGLRATNDESADTLDPAFSRLNRFLGTRASPWKPLSGRWSLLGSE